jgi:hypothetical protein
VGTFSALLQNGRHDDTDTSADAILPKSVRRRILRRPYLSDKLPMCGDTKNCSVLEGRNIWYVKTEGSGCAYENTEPMRPPAHARSRLMMEQKRKADIRAHLKALRPIG